MIQLRNKETGSLLGSISEEDLQFLIDNLEEEWEEDTDYYLNRETLDLLEGGETTPYGTAQEYKAEETLYKMFKSAAFYRMGSSTIEGRLGEPFQTDLGTSYRISFVAQLPDASNSSPWGVRDPGNQLHLRQLVLERKGIASDGTVMTFELLRTNVLLAPKQTVYIGAGSSEDSGDVLVLIVHAREFGSR